MKISRSDLIILAILFSVIAALAITGRCNTEKAYGEEYKTITILDLFEVQIPATMDDFSKADIKLKRLRDGEACGWQANYGPSFYSIVVRCPDAGEPVALVQYVWRSQDIKHWLYRNGIPVECSLRQYVEEVFEKPFVVNPELYQEPKPEV